MVLSALRGRGVLRATVYLPLADVITFYMAAPIFVTALSAIVLGETGRLAALERGRVGFMRRADRAEIRRRRP